MVGNRPSRLVPALLLLLGLGAAEEAPTVAELVAEVQDVDRILRRDELSAEERDEVRRRLEKTVKRRGVTPFLRTEILRRLGDNALAADRAEQGRHYYRLLLFACGGKVNVNWITARLKLAGQEPDARRRTLAFLQLYYLLKGTIPRLALDADNLLLAERGELALYGPAYAEVMRPRLYRKQVIDMALNAMQGLRSDFRAAVDKAEATDDPADRRLARLIERSGVLDEDPDSRFWVDEAEASQ